MGASQAISAASLCVANASAQTTATSRPAGAASAASCASASASAEPVSGAAVTVLSGGGVAGRSRGSATLEADGDDDDEDTAETAEANYKLYGAVANLRLTTTKQVIPRICHPEARHLLLRPVCDSPTADSSPPERLGRTSALQTITP